MPLWQISDFDSRLVSRGVRSEFIWLAPGQMKSDAMLRFGEGHSRVTEAAGFHSAHILTWLITAVVDGIALLHIPWDWMWLNKVLTQHGHSLSHEYSLPCAFFFFFFCDVWIYIKKDLKIEMKTTDRLKISSYVRWKLLENDVSEFKNVIQSQFDCTTVQWFLHLGRVVILLGSHYVRSIPLCLPARCPSLFLPFQRQKSEIPPLLDHPGFIGHLYFS